METKVLLRLIKDDIKLLDEINGSFLSSVTLTHEEVQVALARAKGLVMEFEILSKNLTRLPEIDMIPEVKIKPKVEVKAVPKQKEAPVFNEESELIDLQEEVVSKPIAGTNLPDDMENPLEERQTQKAIMVNEEIPVKPAIVPGNEDLFVAEVVVDKEIQGEIFEDKNQSDDNLIMQERVENNFGGIPLKKLRDGIGMNDKFLFIRELFGNDPEKYEKTINALDEFTAIEEAVAYLKQNFKWNKSEAGHEFLTLVKRRYKK